MDVSPFPFRHGLWCVASVVATLVGDRHAAARLGEGRDLVTPPVPELGEAVEEHDEAAVVGACRPHMQIHARPRTRWRSSGTEIRLAGSRGILARRYSELLRNGQSAMGLASGSYTSSWWRSFRR